VIYHGESIVDEPGNGQKRSKMGQKWVKNGEKVVFGRKMGTPKWPEMVKKWSKKGSKNGFFSG